MSTRNRRRRSELELLDAATAILFPDEEPLEPVPDQTRQEGEDADPTPPGEPDHQVPDEVHPVPDLTPARPQPTLPDEPARQIPDEQLPLPAQADQMEQLTSLTQALQLAGRPSFKPPSFSGVEVVELFLKQFEDMADANR